MLVINRWPEQMFTLEYKDWYAWLAPDARGELKLLAGRYQVLPFEQKDIPRAIKNDYFDLLRLHVGLEAWVMVNADLTSDGKYRIGILAPKEVGVLRHDARNRTA